VQACIWSPDGRLILIGSNHAVLGLYRPDGTRYGEFPAGQGIESVAWHPDSRLLAAGDEYGGVYLLRLEGVG
jgi:hypothetical protein